MSWRFVDFDSSLDRTKFDCGEPALNLYLQSQMSQDFKRKACVPVLAITPKNASVSGSVDAIAGYYTLSMGAIEFAHFPTELKKKIAPYPVPIARIGRLAADISTRGMRLGETLLFHAINRVEKISAKIGVRAIVVDAKNARAVSFYEKYGFTAFPTQAGRKVSLFLIV